MLLIGFQNLGHGRLKRRCRKHFSGDFSFEMSKEKKVPLILTVESTCGKKNIDIFGNDRKNLFYRQGRFLERGRLARQSFLRMSRLLILTILPNVLPLAGETPALQTTGVQSILPLKLPQDALGQVFRVNSPVPGQLEP